MRFLVLRLDAPMMSFGTTAVDHRGLTQRMPALSMLTGLICNGLGYRHAESARTQRLQERLQFASRQDRAGSELQDYQTVDLGDLTTFPAGPFGWTTRGVRDKRVGSVADRTHIRKRDYLADAVHTVVLMLDPADEDPTLDQVAEALRRPARPLFLGRKCCLPARPLLDGQIEAESLVEALRLVPRDQRADAGPLPAWWPHVDGPQGDGTAHNGEGRLMPTHDQRDWANQVHAGRRLLRHGTIVPREAHDGS